MKPVPLVLRQMLISGVGPLMWSADSVLLAGGGEIQHLFPWQTDPTTTRWLSHIREQPWWLLLLPGLSKKKEPERNMEESRVGGPCCGQAVSQLLLLNSLSLEK